MYQFIQFLNKLVFVMKHLFTFTDLLYLMELVLQCFHNENYLYKFCERLTSILWGLIEKYNIQSKGQDCEFSLRLLFWTVNCQVIVFICFFGRLPFTMLVLQKAVKMVWSLREVTRVAYAFMLVMLLWMVLWSFGAAGVVASGMDDSKRWWLLVVRWQV